MSLIFLSEGEGVRVSKASQVRFGPFLKDSSIDLYSSSFIMIQKKIKSSIKSNRYQYKRVSKASQNHVFSEFLLNIQNKIK